MECTEGSTDINCAEERGDEEPEGTSWYIILGAVLSLIAVIVAIIVGIILCRRGTKNPDEEMTTDFSESEFSGTETDGEGL